VNALQRQQVESTQGSVKKAYNRPQLEIYGKLREITKTVGTRQATDSIGCVPALGGICFTGL